MGVYIWNDNYSDYVDYSAMQGPCDSGFHVPDKAELTSLYNIVYTSFNKTTSADFFGVLKMPLCGGLSSQSGDRDNTWTYYWSCSASLVHAKGLGGAGNTFGVYNVPRAGGYSIRPFKNTPVVPDNTWTTLYDGSSIATGAGIFHNATLGLISISGNGTKRITIADKNLGATAVYNTGDTQSQTNCGKYYQRGNNYGFDFSGAGIVSGRQVNASNYGPGNYYLSSTFIGDPWLSNQDWANPKNDNLRGGVTGVSHMSELKNAYIWEYILPYLCFTANTANSTIQLIKNGSPTAVTLETSTDGETWTTYTIGDTITLSNIGDKVYWRNTSTTDTLFSTGNSNYYQFVMTGSIGASGDITTLLNKNGTLTASDSCFYYLFRNCTALTTSPRIPVTTIVGSASFRRMFYYCTSLTSIPALYSLDLHNSCYQAMFDMCSQILISDTQTGEYQTPYRLPVEGTGTFDSPSTTLDMFYNISWPNINTTYYVNCDVVY